MSENGEKYWFALRATYGRELKAQELLKSLGIETFVPQVYQRKRVPSKCNPNKIVERLRRTPVANLIFMFATKQQADEILISKHTIPYLHYRYNHLEGKGQGYENPIIIPHHDMKRFIAISSIDNPNIVMANSDELRYMENKTARVTNGIYQGLEGKVVRIKGHQRILASIGNMRWNIATGYVPTRYMEFLD